jgi:hypothetical protein
VEDEAETLEDEDEAAGAVRGLALGALIAERLLAGMTGLEIPEEEALGGMTKESLRRRARRAMGRAIGRDETTE